MFNFICKSFPHFKHSLTTSSTHELHILQLNHFLLFSSKSEKDSSFSFNYFKDKCGFSPERALSATNYANFNNSDKPDAVISFLKNQGFTETQVFKLIRIYPQVVLSDPENTLLPKINFFLSQGVSKADLTTTLAAAPDIFSTNLDRKIIPAFSCLKKLFGYSGDAIFTVKRCPSLITHFHNVVSNIETLRKVGASESKIRSFLKCWPRALTFPPIRFKEVIKEVDKMGVDPVKSTFFTAIGAMFGLSRSSWKKKMELYKKWGCSKDEVLATFVRDPRCMLVSDDKIDKIMRFFVNEIGWDPSRLMQKSKILSYNLNRRIIPRCAVYQVLILKGFIKEDSSLQTLLMYSEEKFLKKYVECYKKEAPEVLKVYLEKMKLSV